MKQVLAFVLALTMAFPLAACGGKTASDAASRPAEGAVKTGLGISASASVKNEASADDDGSVQTTATAAAVMVDAEGRLLSVKLDAVQPVSRYSTAGAVSPAEGGEVPTKQELGDDYGMAARSEIGKEWFRQADAFAAYVVGKTAEEVAALPPSSEIADLAASCTIDIDGFKAAIADAMDQAQQLGASAGDKLGLALVSTVSGSDANADESGRVKHETTYAVTTTDAQGRITSAVLDASQSRYTVTAAGEAAAADGTVKSKQQLGAEYGMASKSAIGREWFEQANAFAAYAKGKTAGEVAALPQSSGIADLAASCTIGIEEFKAALAKAAA